MNKYFFGAVALVAVLGIGLFAAQSNQVQQAASPEKAKTPVTKIATDGCGSGCCSSEKSALVSTESAKASCCSEGTSEVAAKAGCCGGCSKTETVSTIASKSGCCGGCSKTETVSTKSGAEECTGVCQEGDGSKCCQLAKKDEQTKEKTEAVSDSEENE